jgi:hypothetical protein
MRERVVPVSDTEKRRNLSSTRCVLELAHRYAQSGKIYQATDMYQRLMQKHPETPEGQEARSRILEIAERHEAEGRRHLALSLYEKAAAFRSKNNSADEEQSIGLDEETGTEEAMRKTHRREARETDYGMMDEIPFVDLTEEVNLGRNFERLGEVKRIHADIHLQVDSLRRLKRGL